MENSVVFDVWGDGDSVAEVGRDPECLDLSIHGGGDGQEVPREGNVAGVNECRRDHESVQPVRLLFKLGMSFAISQRFEFRIELWLIFEPRELGKDLLIRTRDQIRGL